MGGHVSFSGAMVLLGRYRLFGVRGSRDGLIPRNLVLEVEGLRTGVSIPR